MPHGQSWLSFLPGYGALQAYFQSQGRTLVSGNVILIQHVAAAALVVALLLFLSLAARASLHRAGSDILPETRLSARTIAELIMEGLLAILRPVFGDDAIRYFPVIGSLGFFILFSNLLGLLPGFLPPTDNFNTTLACGTVVFLYYNYLGFKVNGLGHLGHMANPVGEWWGWFLAPLLFPIEIISHCVRPVSLGIRLMANMTGDHLVLGIFVGLVPMIVPMPFLLLGLFVCLLQTFIFCLLASIYISMAVEPLHHHHPNETHAAHP